jgi:hypothetical protein
MKPPCNPAVDSMASQYCASVPLLLPIACEYSQRMRGLVCWPDEACATISSMDEYIGQTMSLAAWSAQKSSLIAPSYWIGRVGS